MQTAAIIVAAGRGHRAGGDMPKQWREITGQNSVERCLDVFSSHPAIDQIVLVLHADDFMRIDARDGVLFAEGGADRVSSVRNGLLALQNSPPDLVLIHDVARPCVSTKTISNVHAALSHHKGAAPGLPQTDALWRGKDGLIEGSVARDHLFAAQTPQGFHYTDIMTAHQAFDGKAADDVAIARAHGLSVAIVPGDIHNLKITTPDDFNRAEHILRGSMDIRTGNGFDVHAFEDGHQVILCGVPIAHDQALKGHSDADVAMHAITDAIYGALAKGDIGQWFPPSDPQWKGAASKVFLDHAAKLARDDGFDITHVDCTIICEEPKIGPHAQAMRENIGEIIGMDAARISVKATTSERLGFTGRGEGIAAMATATLVKQ